VGDVAGIDRVVIVSKPTRLDELVRQHFTLGAARFALESREQSVERYEAEDRAQRGALAEIRRQIPNDLPVTSLTREDLPAFLFRDKDLVVVCGPDGLFVNTAKYIANQLVLSVNPDPRTVAGVLMLFPPHAVGELIARIRAGHHRAERLPFIKATIDDDAVVWGVNDVFLGRRDQISARYAVSFAGRLEHQSSSGVIVSSGVGASGWLRSIATMAAGLDGVKSPRLLASLPHATSSELVFVVREAFPSPDTGTSIVTGRVRPDKPLALISEMPDGGCVFSDGIVEKAVDWPAGSRVTVTVGDRYVTRVVH
jgi:hypothetical protein